MTDDNYQIVQQPTKYKDINTSVKLRYLVFKNAMTRNKTSLGYTICTLYQSNNV